MSSPWVDLGRMMAGERSSTAMAKLDGIDDGGRRLGLDFGRFWARSRSWRVGVGGRRGCAARGATNRGGAASSGRRDERRRGLLDLTPSEPRMGMEGEDGMGQEGSRVSARIRAALRRRGSLGFTTRGVARRRPAAVWASGHSIEHRKGTVCSFK